MLGEDTTLWELLVVAVNLDREVDRSLLVHRRDGRVQLADILVANLGMDDEMSARPQSRRPLLVWKFQGDVVGVMGHLVLFDQFEIKLIILVLFDVLEHTWWRLKVKELTDLFCLIFHCS